MKADEWAYLKAVCLKQAELEAAGKPEWKAPELVLGETPGLTRKRAEFLLNKWCEQDLYLWLRPTYGRLLDPGLALARLCLAAQAYETRRDAHLKLVELDFLSDLGTPPPAPTDHAGLRSYRGAYPSGPVVGIFDDQGDNGLHLHTRREIRNGFDGGIALEVREIAWLRVLDDPARWAKLQARYDARFKTAGAFSRDPRRVP